MRSPVGPLDAAYPDNLRPLAGAPPLFCRGELRPDDARSVAVVGTRSPSPEGLTLARRLAAELARGGFTVVSGLARGLDTAAHAAALEAGGRSIAVLGCGIGRVYPPENAGLADRIAGRGAVVSQHPGEAPPSPAALRERNRVIAGLVRAVVVVEAGPTSGARIAARWAMALGRPLWITQLVAAEPWVGGLLAHSGVHLVGGGAQGILAQLAEDGCTSPVQLALLMTAPG
ncbi:MAG: DNA-processing protein DprA [Candidatus Dormibacteria bacterium]